MRSDGAVAAQAAADALAQKLRKMIDVLIVGAVANRLFGFEIEILLFSQFAAFDNQQMRGFEALDPEKLSLAQTDRHAGQVLCQHRLVRLARDTPILEKLMNLGGAEKFVSILIVAKRPDSHRVS